MIYKIQNPAVAGGKRSKSGKPNAYVIKRSTKCNGLSIQVKTAALHWCTLQCSVHHKTTGVKL
jgi:hypothetical protein